MTHSGMSVSTMIQVLRKEGEAYRRRQEASFSPLPAPTDDGCRVICWFGEQHVLPMNVHIALLRKAMDEAGAFKKNRTDQHDTIRTVNAFADAQRPPIGHVDVETVRRDVAWLPQIRKTAINNRITRAQIEAITNDMTSSHPATRGLTYWDLAKIEPKIAENQPHPDDVFVLGPESSK